MACLAYLRAPCSLVSLLQVGEFARWHAWQLEQQENYDPCIHELGTNWPPPVDKAYLESPVFTRLFTGTAPLAPPPLFFSCVHKLGANWPPPVDAAYLESPALTRLFTGFTGAAVLTAPLVYLRAPSFTRLLTGPPAACRSLSRTLSPGTHARSLNSALIAS